MSSQKRKCPKCKWGNYNRVRRNKLVKKVLFWLPLKRFKCNACDHNIYTLR